MNQLLANKSRIAQITNEYQLFIKGFPDDFYNRKTGVFYAPAPNEKVLGGVEGAHANGITGRGVKVAIIDTGLMLSHPLIQRRVVESVDYTGEGPEDRNGHGTVVAFILIAFSPEVDIVNVKCFKSSGFATEFDLKRGLRWCMDRKIEIINISGGVDDPSCQGDCNLCRTAIQVGDSGSIIQVAAGNNPKHPLCPGKAGFKSDAIYTIGAYDVRAGRIADYSAMGENYGNVGDWQLFPIQQS